TGTRLPDAYALLRFEPLALRSVDQLDDLAALYGELEEAIERGDDDVSRRAYEGLIGRVQIHVELDDTDRDRVLRSLAGVYKRRSAGVTRSIFTGWEAFVEGLPSARSIEVDSAQPRDEVEPVHWSTRVLDGERPVGDAVL